MKEIHSIDLTPAERELSAALFNLYHGNSKPGQRSRVSDQIVLSLRGDESAILEIATGLAKMAAPDHESKMGKVAGFIVTPAQRPISDLLHSLLHPKEPPTLEFILEMPLSTPLFGVNPLVLWARAVLMLETIYTKVEFQSEYIEVSDDSYRPAIRGAGINMISVNGALLEVLREANLADDIDYLFFATHCDDEGWVYSRGGIDG